MTKEYIEREALIRHLNDELEACGDACIDSQPIVYGTILGLKGAMSYANTLPAADVVEVVRCKDCVNYCGFERCNNGICDVDPVSKRAVYPTDFCSYGEMNENNG